jgi:hypothetical protein
MHWEAPISNAITSAVAAGLLTLASTSIDAQGITDPTAPPAALLRALEQAQRQDAPAENAGAEAGTADVPPASTDGVIERLRAGEWARAAWIGGKRRELGERTDRGTLASIRPNGVQFEKDGERSTERVVDNDVVKKWPGDRPGDSKP